MKKVLITGAAGFIGSYLSKELIKKFQVIGLDNLNEYYDINLKYERLKMLEENKNFTFIKTDISNKEELFNVFKDYKPDFVVNLAAQPGVRYSIENPDAYIQSNIIGFYNVLEACRFFPVEHLVYASSSSVYGHSKDVPFEEDSQLDSPVSLYAATKKSNELMAYTYSHLYSIPASGLRFFTVYGPLGRPDMAYFGFTDKYFNDEPIRIFNNGDFENDMYRDFTYIDDIVEGIVKLLDVIPDTNNGAMHEVYNIGNSSPVKLMDYIFDLESALSESLGRNVEFQKKYEPIKPGDVPATYASTEKLENAVGYRPDTSTRDGLQKFTDWYVDFYNKK